MARSNFLQLLKAPRAAPAAGSSPPAATNTEAKGYTKTPGATETPGVVEWSGLPKIRPARTAQDGHSLVEQAIYEFLWKGSGNDANDLWREADGGYGRLSKRLGIGAKTIKRALRSLREKLSIEPIGKYDVEANTPTRFRVYSYRSILERRKDAGLEWCIRNRGGVSLVQKTYTKTPGATEPPGVTEPPAPGGLETPGPGATEPPPFLGKFL